MKKVLALLICVLFVLSTNSFALWGIGEKKPEAKGKIHAKEMGKGKKLGIKKQETKVKKAEKKAEKKEKKAAKKAK
jgi:hypothetical protein